MCVKMEPQSPEKGGVGPENCWDKAWPTRIEEKGVVREGSPSIKLGLGIGDDGLGGEQNRGIKEGKCVFTAKQLQELHQQALIYKYFVAGLSLPFHLLLPIWKSVVSSFGSDNGGFYNHYPSFIGFCPKGFDYKSIMDPEPWRCRRTDGKKWRCGRNVVPDQKYCERHMHRGRQRSRKHVEASEHVSESGKTTKKISFNDTTMTLNSDNTNKNINFSIPVHTNLQITPPSSNTKNTATTITTSSAIRSNKNIYVNNESYGRPTTIKTYNSSNEGNNNVNVSSDTIGTTIATTSSNAATDKGSSRNNHSYLDGKDSGFNYTNDRQNINRSRKNGNNRKFGSSVDPGFGFSPKSVLRGGTVVGCSSLGVGYGTVLETEPQRCRRTDGKKWRCGWDVVPEQKYCGRHMHRGVKKTILPSTPVTVAAAPPPPFAVPKKVDDRVKLNTNLSISIVQSPQPICDEGNSTSGSSSDATTITDENTGVSHILALSP